MLWRLSRCLASCLALLACGEEREAQALPAPAAVRIYRDELGLPHVFADSDAGVFRGLGYSQTRDFPVATLANLWSGTGRFAEIAGASLLARDERMRQWGFDRRAHELATEPDALDARAKEWLRAYVDGVNAGRRWWQEHPASFDALVGAKGELCFDPVPQWLHPQLMPKDDDPRARLARLFELEVGLEHVLAFGLTLAAGPEFGGAGQGRTNVWAMRSTKGVPATWFLADVHQPLQEYGYRSYFVQLAGPSYDLVGYTSPGFPCVVLGANRSLAFGSMTLPKTPRELAKAGLPFRIDEQTPVVSSTWSAKLQPGEPACLVRGTERLGLESQSVTLRAFDAAKKSLVDDPRGALRLRWVADGALRLPLVAPGPSEPLELAAGTTIRYEARSFLTQRSLWETWLNLGLCKSAAGGAEGAWKAMEREWLSTGRGQLFLDADVTGNFGFLWSTRAPVLSDKARGLIGSELDGSDARLAWRDFHGFEALPRLTTLANPSVPAWIVCNSSPHFLAPRTRLSAASAPEIHDGREWKTLRQDRARELFERANADGKLEANELERMALDVQDQWSRANWPRLSALRLDAEMPLSERARRFVEWLEVYRLEGPDGKPGDEEFVASPLSQVMPFLVLVRDRYEDELIAARAPADALGLAFDAVFPAPSAMEFVSGERFAPNRAALRAAVEWAAELRERTLTRQPGGLVNHAFLSALAERKPPCDSLLAAPWGAPLYAKQAAEWGPAAPPLALRWGEMNVYALTPHRWSTLPSLGKPAQVEAWLNSILAPCAVKPPLEFYRRQPAVVFPIGGTHDSLFQVHNGDPLFLSYAKALLPRDKDFLALAPVDFGSQALFLAELVVGARPRVHVLVALAATELVGEFPENGTSARDLFRPTERFAHGEWSELVTDEATLRALPGVRVFEVGD
ncbi:MAG: hypothetical protein EXS08_13125 [Planctomycetes bacterium]|nr:hypothetical protein [Planctomycetota bacterium]